MYDLFLSLWVVLTIIVLPKYGFSFLCIAFATDLRNEKIGFKIREHTLQATPYLLVAGHREMDNGEIAVRTQKGDDLGTMSVDDFANKLADDLVMLR